LVTSASYEARAFGVHSAMPMARAVRLLSRGNGRAGAVDACAQKGREIGMVAAALHSVVEQASSDEFYLDLSGTEELYGREPLAATARRMRDAVLAETLLTLSIGGGTSKFVAKLAAGLAKPRPGRPADGVHVVSPARRPIFMLQFALADIPLIGPRFQERLGRFGLRTVRDVVRCDRETLIGWLESERARGCHERARGVDRAQVETNREAKSVSRTRRSPRT